MLMIVRRVWRGLHYSEKYGSHPGTPVLMMLILFGALAGGIMGVLVMAACFMPLYLYGAYARGE